MEGLQQVFLDFTSFGAGQSGSSEMDSAKFVKLAKDCKLVGKHLSTTDLDLIFTKVKDKTEKKINFDTFVEAVNLVAEKMGKSTDDIINIIVSAKGPTTGDATVADNVRFHDDKATFTGVHNHGGPSQLDSHNVDMANQLDRLDDADVRGVKNHPNNESGASASSRRSSQEEATRRASNDKKAASPRNSSGSSASPRKSSGGTVSPRKSSGGASSSPRKPSTTPRMSADGGAIGGDDGGNGGDMDIEARVQDVFVAFASSVAKASGDMDGMKFFKLMGDSGLVGKSLSRTDCDLMFTRTCSMSGCVKKIHFDAFRKVAVALVAAHLKTDEGSVMAKIASVKGISSSGTVAQASRFHDDKSTYTGSHASGGPTHVDQRVSLDSLANRSSADVRGVQASVYKLDPKATYRSSTGSTSSLDAEDRRRSSGSVAAGSAVVSPMIPKADGAASRGSESRKGSSSASASADRRKSSLAQAGGTIAGSANKKGGVYDRLCDQKSYTGVYAERFKGDGGRINGDTANDRVSFSGSTNSGGNHAVSDLSQICNRG